MLDLSKDINSLSAFKRNSLEFLERLRSTGNALVLTVNGKAALVVQDIDSYQELCNQASRSAEQAVEKDKTVNDNSASGR